MKVLNIPFKPVFAIIVTGLCFAFFFLKGVDNGIMVLATLAVKHYFDSTADTKNKDDIIGEALKKSQQQNEKHTINTTDSGSVK